MELSDQLGFKCPKCGAYVYVVTNVQESNHYLVFPGKLPANFTVEFKEQKGKSTDKEWISVKCLADNFYMVRWP